LSDDEEGKAAAEERDELRRGVTEERMESPGVFATTCAPDYH
jgi:hypothetical protein